MIGFDQYHQKRQESKGYSPFKLALLMATGIGLHNLGEGLAIGSSFALGEAALGTFLIIGFTLHNITEGIGIAAPLLKTKPQCKGLCNYWEQSLGHLLLLVLGSVDSSSRQSGGFILRDWSRCHFTSNLYHY